MAESTAPRVLVVDDEPEIRQLLADALAESQMELHVDVAASGSEALDRARRVPPDIVVADLYLGDCSGLDVIDRLRSQSEDLSAVVITGKHDPAVLTQASRCRPLALMTKPLDLDRLRDTIQAEITRQASSRRAQRRALQLRQLARRTNIERKAIHRKLDETCADLANAFQTLSGQLSLQQTVISYQQQLVSACNDDDVFRALFRLFVQRSGPIFGVAMVCNADAELQMVGRFGVPYPDESEFCNRLVRPVVAAVLSNPRCILMDAGEEQDLFDESIQRYLPGLSLLGVPLVPVEGQLIGLVVLYRKGEQPFTQVDLALAEVVALPTALAIRRTD